MSKVTRSAARKPVWETTPLVLTAGVLVIVTVAVIVNIATAARAGSGVVGYVAILLAAGGVALSLKHPYPGLVVIASAAPLAVAGSLTSTGVWSVACFAAFLLTLRGASALVTGAVIAASNLAAAGWEVGTIDVRVDSTASVAAFAAIVTAAIGSSIRGNLRYRREVEERMHDAEANRATAIDRGVAQERLRIARDLHDSVGHQVAVVNMHLGAAEVHLPPEAAAARDDLAAARRGVQAVLRETQQILRVLRVGDAAERSEHGYRSVGELVETYRSAGMNVEDAIDDLPEDISPNARAAVYRIVQEGLTNAQKHGVGTVSVMLKHEDDRVRVELVNMRDTRAEPDEGTGGNGLVGMRERAESAGGTLEVRAGERLFWLTATIPTRRGES